MNDTYCLMSNDVHNSVINQCLGYDWKRKAILNTINIPISHHIHSQFFLKIMLIIEIMICIINTQNDINNHTGYTQSNFVSALSSVNARIANILSVGAHTIESHNVRNIQNIINAFAIDKKSISTHVFLFSVLLTLEKNIAKQIRVAVSIQIKWKLKFCGLNIVNQAEPDEGKYVPVSNAKAV